jgi:hypothetical protein
VKWEHKVVLVPTWGDKPLEKHVENINDLLETWGEAGWELVTANASYFYFKRPQM